MKNRPFVCLVVLFVFSISDIQGATREQMEKMSNGFRNTCITKTGVDRSVAEGIRDGVFVEDPLAKCYTKCVMSLVKSFTKEGTIDLNVIVKQINIMGDPETAVGMIASAKVCHGELTPDEPCELAWRYTKCVYAKDPSTFFFP